MLFAVVVLARKFSAVIKLTPRILPPIPKPTLRLPLISAGPFTSKLFDVNSSVTVKLPRIVESVREAKIVEVFAATALILPLASIVIF